MRFVFLTKDSVPPYCLLPLPQPLPPPLLEHYMKRFFSFILALMMAVSLCACGGSETDVLFTEVSSVDAVSQQLGYDMLTLDSKDDAITWSTAAFRSSSDAAANDAVGQLTYVSGKSTIDLRMTMDETRGTGLAGYENAGYAGSVEAPNEDFSDLDIYVMHSDLFFSEFTFTSGKSTCYLSLSKNKTDLDSFSRLLINFVQQLYTLTDTPDFALKEQRKAEIAAEKEAFAEAQKEAESGFQLQPVAPPAPEPVDPVPTEPVPAQPEAPAVTGTITLEYYDMTFRPNEGYTLHPSGGTAPYTWTSADETIATVTNEGSISTHAVGQTTLTVTSSDGLSANVIIRVKAAY